jgi:hypothetical protein
MNVVSLMHEDWVFVGSCCSISTVGFGDMFYALFYNLFYIALVLFHLILRNACELDYTYEIVDDFVMFLFLYYNYGLFLSACIIIMFCYFLLNIFHCFIFLFFCFFFRIFWSMRCLFSKPRVLDTFVLILWHSL